MNICGRRSLADWRNAGDSIRFEVGGSRAEDMGLRAVTRRHGLGRLWVAAQA